MAENRGGMRPTAPQNNPMSVSGNGGNGQAGDKARKAMQLRPSGGGEYGATQALQRQIQEGGNVRTTAPAAASRPAPMRVPVAELSPLPLVTEPSLRSGEDITTGSLANPVGMMTPGPEALMLPGGGVGDSKFTNNINAYYPVLAYIAGRDDTSEDTRQIINTLMRAI